MEEDKQQQSEEVEDTLSFDEVFDAFCKVGDRTSDEIALRNVDKWFKQANAFSRTLTTTDTAIQFAKVAKGKKKLSKAEFLEFLGELAREKGLEVEELRTKLTAEGGPAFRNITRPIRGSVAADAMDRLTNPELYTGTHKERFDKEGRGLGMAGRYDVADDDGYVQGYKKSSTSSQSSEDDDDEEKKKKKRKEGKE